MPTLYIRLAAYVGAALAVFFMGYHVGGLGPKASLAALQAQDWQAKAVATQNVLNAVQAQLKSAQATAANNSTVIQGLQNENAKITANWASDRALAQRLLNAAARPSGGSPMPETQGGRTVVNPSTASGDGSIAGLLADAAAECEHNASQLNALIAEIQPQL